MIMCYIVLGHVTRLIDLLVISKSINTLLFEFG